MSLALEAPLARPRPRPPSTSRRRSLLFPPISPATGEGVTGVLGGLRERSEDELRTAGRDALELALRESWERNDELLGRLTETEEAHRKVQTEKAALEGLVGKLQQGQDQLLKEQGRVEAELESRDEMLDRLRKRANEAERLARASAVRAEEQEASFEAERQALQAHETHLQQRIAALRSARAAVPLPTDVRTVEELQSELASLGMSHSAALAQLNTLTKEVHDLRLTNASLADEHEGWELLLRERTLSGEVRESGLLGVREEMQSPREVLLDEGKSALEALEEEMETAELHGDVEAQSPMGKDGGGFPRDLDEGPRWRHGNQLQPDRRQARDEEAETMPRSGPRVDLATELGVAEGKAKGGENGVQADGDEVGATRLPVAGDCQAPRSSAALHAELKSLREENKALTLYCSKIIDRIIAQPGFEHVLSVDYKTHRTGPRSASASHRGDLSEVVSAMREGQAGGGRPELIAPHKEPDAGPATTMPVGVETDVEQLAASPDPAVMPNPEVQETKSQKRTRRGFSLDFRMLSFGSSASSTPPQAKPNPSLKPLALASRTTPIPKDSKSVLGRRLAKQEDDEDDRRERHRLEASLKLWGVDRLSTSDASSPTFAGTSRKLIKPGPRSESQEERQALIQPQPFLPPGTPRRGTPLGRLSSALGSHDSPVSPISPDIYSGKEGLPPEVIAQAAIRAFDEREAEQVKALSRGEGGGAYTSPKGSGVRRASQRRHVSGRTSTMGDSEPGADAVGAQKARAGGSVSTLWSMGSSRPKSQELDAGRSQRA